MRLPPPETLHGVLDGATSSVKPDAAAVSRIAGLIDEVREGRAALGDEELRLLVQSGFSSVAYESLYNQPEKARLFQFLSERGLLPAEAEAVAVTAYVPCFNGAETLPVCLAAIKNQSVQPAEILVVDDGSTDGSADIARQHGARVIMHERNRGLGAARNTAVEHANGEFIAGFDADTIPHPFWLARMLPRVQPCGMSAAGGRLIERYSMRLPDSWRARVMKQHHGELPTENMLLFGCNSIARVADIKKIGGYGADYQRSFEDVDFTRRFIEAGGKTAYEPTAFIWHNRKDSLNSILSAAYSWRRPPFESRGVYADLNAMLAKWTVSIRGDLDELNYLRSEGRDELLIISFLNLLYSIVYDLTLYQGVPAENRPAFIDYGSLLATSAAGKISGLKDAARKMLGSVLSARLEGTPSAIGTERRRAIVTNLDLEGAEEALRAVPPLDEAVTRRLHLGLGELHTVLNLGPDIFAAIDSGAKIMANEAAGAPEVIFPPGSADRAEPKLGSRLSLFEWIEMLAGSAPGAAKINLNEIPPHEAEYLRLRLAVRCPGRRFEEA